MEEKPNHVKENTDNVDIESKVSTNEMFYSNKFEMHINGKDI